MAKKKDTSVACDTEWIDYIKGSNAMASHVMFSSQSYLDSFWIHAEHGIFLLDENTNIIDANPYFLDMLDCTLAEVQTKKLADITPNEFHRTDFTNINAIILGKQYSYTKDSELTKKMDKGNLIPVKLVATRVPSSLNYPFKHIIVQVYPRLNYDDMKKFGLTYTEDKSLLSIFKSLLFQPWFTKSLFALIAFICIILAFSGDLAMVINKCIDKWPG